MCSFKKRKKYIGYIGVGIKELYNKERIQKFSYIINQANIMTFRDEKSWMIAKNMSNNPYLYQAEDLVYLCEEVISEKREQQKLSTLVISWRCLEHYYDEKVEKCAADEVVKFVSKHADEYHEIVVAVIGNFIDVRMNKYIFDALQNQIDANKVVLRLQLSLSEKMELLRGAKTVICGRLHAIFVAEWYGIKTLAISYDSKIDRFMESISKEEDLIYPDEISVDLLEQWYSRPNEDVAAEWQNKRKAAEKNINLFADSLKH